jgi:hypothetical protein
MTSRFPLAVLAAAAVSAAFALAAGAQVPGSQTAGNVLGPLATLDVSTLVPPTDPTTDPASTQSATTDPPNMPKFGNYQLFGTAKDDRDPRADLPNPFNEVISFDTTDPNAIAGAFRKFGDHVQVGMFTDQLELKYFFVGRTCGGGSPRFQLGISGDGDPQFNQFPGGPDQNAFGYLGDRPFGGGCLMNQWVYEDMTNGVPKWDLSQFAASGAAGFCGGNAMICTWAQVVTFFNTVFPNHRVLNAVLVDDSGGFFAPDRGCGYFDLVSTGRLTLTGHEETSGGGSQPNGC